MIVFLPGSAEAALAMAEARQNWIPWLAVGAISLSALAPAFAQTAPILSTSPHSVQIPALVTGSLAGRLTNLHSAPLAGVSVILRNQATGAQVHAITEKNGAFHFASLDAGEYTLDAISAQLGSGQLTGIHISGGMKAHLQAAIQFEPAAPARLIAPALPAATRAGQLPPQSTTPLSAKAPSTQQRASLATQSLLFQPTLTATLPRTLPLTGTFRAALTANAAAVRALLAAVVNIAPVAPVSIAAQQPDPSTPAVTTTLTAAQLEELPVSGRRWQQFLLDTPSANAAPDSLQTSFRGAQNSATVTIDGANTRLAFGVTAGTGTRSTDDADSSASQSSPISRSWTGSRNVGVSEAAIREVTTAAGNAEVESMRSSGGQTNILTATGANALHGQGFLFDRQNNWGARNPYTQWVQNTGSAQSPTFTALPFTPPDHEMVWGIGAGGRIRRDKLFWFAALDSSRRNDPGLSTVKNPAEFFQLPEPTSPAVTLLSAQLGESANQAYNDYLGIASSGYAPAGLEQLAALLGPAARTSTQFTGFARIDWRATERQHFTLEGTAAAWNSPGGGMTRVSATYGNHSFGSTKSSDEWLLGRWEVYLTPNLLAVSQGSAGRKVATAPPSAPSPFEQSFLNGNFWGQLPQIVVDSRYGFTIGNPSRFGQGSFPDERLYHGQQMLDWAHNRLLVRAGFELDHNADAVSLLRNQTGTYHYASVAGFISDALAFQKFGLADALDPRNPHNCGATSTKFGSQPCYSYYTQTMGPNDWHLSTNDWAGFLSAQWQPAKLAVLSAGLRWEREQLPPPMTALSNPDLPLTQTLPTLGNNWGPRASLAIGSAKGPWPVFRLGYGMYYGRLRNATLETALTQTGSLRGDLSFFMRPSDDCQFCVGGAPPFPYVFAGRPSSAVKPGAIEFAPNFRNSEVHQAVAALEESLPGRVQLAASAMLSLGRRLPISIDTNFDPSRNPGTITYNVKDPTGKGPIKTTQITVPFYASWPSATSPTGTAGRLNPNYQQIAEITSRVNSTYEGAMVRITREGRRGLTLHAHYTYGHAMDWNPNETTLVAGSDPLDPANFRQEYGTSNLDVRHSAAVIAILSPPWKLRDLAGRLANNWALSGIGQFHSGLPYTMRTSGSLPEEFTNTGAAIAGLGPGMNGSGGDNRVYGVGRNAFRYPLTWKADLRLARRFDLGEMRQLEILAETFNLFNHQNVTQIETTGYSIENSGASGILPTLCYLTMNTSGYASCGTATTTGTGTPLPAFGQPLNINATDFYRERQIDFGLRLKF
jgi:Carboxypeptidase regulatory-like domain